MSCICPCLRCFLDPSILAVMVVLQLLTAQSVLRAGASILVLKWSCVPCLDTLSFDVCERYPPKCACCMDVFFCFDVLPFLGHRKSPSAVCSHHFTFEQRAWLLLCWPRKKERHIICWISRRRHPASCLWFFDCFLETQEVFEVLGRFGSSPFRVFLLRWLRFPHGGISTVARTVVSLRCFWKVLPNVPLEKMRTATHTCCLGILSGDESRWKSEKKMLGLFG